MKKLLVIVATVCIVMAMATCFASSGEEAFVEALTEQINADSMWGAVTPIVPILSFLFIFAFAFMILRKTTKKGSRGRFGF